MSHQWFADEEPQESEGRRQNREQAYQALSETLDTERARRRAAEAQLSELQVYVRQLETELTGKGKALPPRKAAPAPKTSAGNQTLTEIRTVDEWFVADVIPGDESESDDV